MERLRRWTANGNIKTTGNQMTHAVSEAGLTFYLS